VETKAHTVMYIVTPDTVISANKAALLAADPGTLLYNTLIVWLVLHNLLCVGPGPVTGSLYTVFIMMWLGSVE